MDRVIAFAVICILAAVLLGCGTGEEPRIDFPQVPVEVQYGNGVRAVIEEMENSLRAEGLSGLRTTVESSVENLEGYSSRGRTR